MWTTICTRRERHDDDAGPERVVQDVAHHQPERDGGQDRRTGRNPIT